LQSHSASVRNLAATYALISDTDAAERFARDAAAAGIDDALRMPADLAEAYLQLRWHREAIDCVWAVRCRRATSRP
jgi:hypothetical protein